MPLPGAWDATADQWQDITNAQPSPARRSQIDTPQPIPVTARIAWARDGEEQLDTVAIAWSGRIVLVRIEDPRRQTNGVWLDAADVKRREPKVMPDVERDPDS